MSIGAGVLLFVIGAILRFALNIEVSWINIPLVGNIVMGAGVVVFVLGLIFTFRRRRTTTARRQVVDRGAGQETVRRTEATEDTGL
ncbi:DUF6458 family protein [Arthrobacter dokdonensis]|uniref:DUF6458 family protein n=1 Tax=Arthrobacter dokdonellae TaxID=2211210 RepID=UPI000DE5A52B|nr:DUF6458 family protein [Arthrobacter dokdonellae]